MLYEVITGTLWAEGPAWNGVGRYLVWSDIPNNVQMRWIEDDGRVTEFRSPAGYSNGNTFRITSYNVCYTKLLRYAFDSRWQIITNVPPPIPFHCVINF